MDDWDAVAGAINERMLRLRLTQRELSARSGVSLSTLRELQHGQAGRRRSNRTLASVAEALGWPADHLHRILRGEPMAAAEVVGQGEESPVLAELRAIRERLDRIDARLDVLASGSVNEGDR